MNIKERISALLNEMKKRNIDAYIVPSSDPHISEYVAEHWKCRAWISGFTGSYGTVVITENECGLWTDGRYFTQAEKQLKDSGIELFRMGQPDVPSFTEWIKDKLQEGQCVGFDGTVLSQAVVSSMEKVFLKKGLKINSDFDLIDLIWSDRPEIPKTEVYNHELQYAGISTEKKLHEVRKQMEKLSVDNYIIGSLDDIAWLYNIRANDVHCNPVTISYAVVKKEEAFLFIDERKVSKEVIETLKENGVTCKPYEEVFDFVSSIDSSSSVFIDQTRINRRLFDSIPASCRKVRGTNITTKLKAIKNEVEIKNLKKCNIKDGTAFVKFLYWLDKNIGKIKLNEVSVAEKLEEFRKEQELFVGPSFDTIAGYKEHGAIIHYKASKESAYELKNQGMLLLDSGGQYLDGTTDITRTIALGIITEEEKFDFTLVLKGHIQLSMAKFMHGTTGSSLDILARQPLWSHGMNYNHGTGHGVGFFLNVHEGPHNISPKMNTIALEHGMVVTNEPGLYKVGKYGIRLENDILVVQDEKNDFGQFMRFESLTLAPFDLNAIIPQLLNDQEKAYLNNYHRIVFETLAPFLNDDERKWLKNNTRSI